MNRLAITLLTLSLFSQSVFGADTFASQLRSAKHIGVTIDDELAAYTIHIYTPSQYKEHVASLESFRRDREAFDERTKSYNRQRQEAHERGAKIDVLNAMTHKRNRELALPPFSLFDKRIKLNTVVSAGDDLSLIHI